MLLGTRHACDQGDGLKSYTWTKYDVREGGVQVIEDDTNNVRLTTEFFKVPGGKHGGSWAARVKGEPLDIGMSYRAHRLPRLKLIPLRQVQSHLYHFLHGNRWYGWS